MSEKKPAPGVEISIHGQMPAGTPARLPLGGVEPAKPTTDQLPSPPPPKK